MTAGLHSYPLEELNRSVRPNRNRGEGNGGEGRGGIVGEKGKREEGGRRRKEGECKKMFLKIDYIPCIVVEVVCANEIIIKKFRYGFEFTSP